MIKTILTSAVLLALWWVIVLWINVLFPTPKKLLPIINRDKNIFLQIFGPGLVIALIFGVVYILIIIYG